MEWNRTETLALAVNSCSRCFGVGTVPGKRGEYVPCGCVSRAIFRACYARFVACVTRDAFTTITKHVCSGKNRRVVWGLKEEEYIADFELAAKRHLTEFDHKVFRLHFVLGADCKLCCDRLKIDRGAFFHSVYRIQTQLGRAFRETEPFPLYPTDEYFNGRFGPTHGDEEIKVVAFHPIEKPRPLVPPLKQAA